MVPRKIICRKCGIGLNGENWNQCHHKAHSHICKKCHVEQGSLWRKANPGKAKAKWTRTNRMNGMRPFDENRECPQFLGVHIAERVLSHVFKDVERMPILNRGYDFICNQGKRIDVKSSCLWKNGCWGFHIEHNTIADYFLCLAFDNRKDLTPLHAWLIPGHVVNHLKKPVISPNTIHKWNKYRLDISKVSACCDALR